MVRCPAGPWFGGPIEFPAWEGKDKHDPGTAGAGSSASVLTARAVSRRGMRHGNRD
jgi:hypothetical protein